MIYEITLRDLANLPGPEFHPEMDKLYSDMLGGNYDEPQNENDPDNLRELPDLDIFG